MSTEKPAEKCAPESESPDAPAEKDSDKIIMESLLTKTWKEAEAALRKHLPLTLEKSWKEAKLDGYNPLLFLDQSNLMGEDHADRVYSSLCKFEEQKDILLIIGSRGGRIEPAYLISKNCRAVAKKKFSVVVPRRAKSAATLLSLGADEIHMGSMSELGPIDPQFNRIPALSLTNALQTMARVVSDYPQSADMFAKYLQSQLDIGMLGYFERINESAIQYAARLLHGRPLPDGQTAEKLAAHLVNHYKDHSFVIDKDEAMTLFGSKILKVQTDEYVYANQLDQNLRWVSRLAKWRHKKVVTFVGGFNSCLKIRDLAEDED